MSWEADKTQIEDRLAGLDDYVKLLDHAIEKQVADVREDCFVSSTYSEVILDLEDQLEDLKKDLGTLQLKFDHLHDDLMDEIKIQVKYQLSLSLLRNKS